LAKQKSASPNTIEVTNWQNMSASPNAVQVTNWQKTVGTGEIGCNKLS